MHCIGFPKKHFCVVDPYSRGESGWCPDGTSTPGAWRHAGVQFLLSGAAINSVDPVQFVVFASVTHGFATN